VNESFGHVPDYHEPFLGWRVWLLQGEGTGLRVRSVVYDTHWPMRTALHALCLQRFGQFSGPHAAPEANCRCGIYAASELEPLIPYLKRRKWWRRNRLDRVFGLVYLWGEVLTCERGWRASDAYPARLYVPVRAHEEEAAAHEVAGALGHSYGVPVEVLELPPKVSAPDALRWLQRAA
jgi:hypothetical protein